MNYKGVIIEESLENPILIKDLTILETKVEQVTASHQTPWLKQWTLHTVEIPENKAEEIARKIGQNLETEHMAWYADFKNDGYHFIIFSNRVFKVDRTKPEEYENVKRYGVNLGIPDYQLDFSPDIK